MTTRRHETAARLDRWLRVAATPTFAVVALPTAFADSEGSRAMAMTDAHATGMVVMYASMGLFHASPWLRSGFDRPDASTEAAGRAR